MAKIAVLFMLFALVAVSSAARIPRDDKAAAQPIDIMKGVNDLSAYMQSLIESPEAKKTLQSLQDAVKSAVGEENFNNLLSNSKNFQKDAEEFWKNQANNIAKLTAKNSEASKQ